MQKFTLYFLSLIFLCSCKESVFTSKVETAEYPASATELKMQKLETDEFYSQFFSIYDNLLISSNPNSNEYFFYVSELNNNKPLGGFMRRGQGPAEYISLAPIRRIERKGDDLIALTYEPNRRELLEWNITKSIEKGRDSVKTLGSYKNANDLDLAYSAIYKIGNAKYLASTPGFTSYNGTRAVPTYWLLEGIKGEPTQYYSFVKSPISNSQCSIGEDQILDSSWSLSPDNSKIVTTMKWLDQINIIDINNNHIRSYRVNGSPNENIFYGRMENPKYHYQDVVCSDSLIYALYSGETIKEFSETMGCDKIYVFDWDGEFKEIYHLPVPLLRIWLDPSSNILYGYSESEEALYRLDL